MATITAISNRGTEMKFDASVWAKRNWLYLNGTGIVKGSKVCIDLATGEIVKGQCHSAPVFASGEIARIAKDFS